MVAWKKNRGRIAVGRGRVIEKEIRDELLLMHGVRVAIFHENFYFLLEYQNLVIKREHPERKLLLNLFDLMLKMQ